jgi:hypothetical protein
LRTCEERLFSDRWWRQFAENAECNSGLGGRAGFADHIDRPVFAVNFLKEIGMIPGRKRVPSEENFGAVARRQSLDHRASSQIRAADTDRHKRIAAVLDLLGKLLDLRHFSGCHHVGGIHPPQKVASPAGALSNSAIRKIDFALPSLHRFR